MDSSTIILTTSYVTYDFAVDRSKPRTGFLQAGKDNTDSVCIMLHDARRDLENYESEKTLNPGTVLGVDNTYYDKVMAKSATAGDTLEKNLSD